MSPGKTGPGETHNLSIKHLNPSILFFETFSFRTASPRKLSLMQGYGIHRQTTTTGSAVHMDKDTSNTGMMGINFVEPVIPGGTIPTPLRRRTCKQIK